ncbi:AAA family ATPase [Sediminibacillus albus]|uniref:Uncharacterized protein YhaN n=1 Tax=Sediminibacillus albus TaxID=407036 RepID=A0A1G8XEM5_9BACI|nr:AAA family ATPase [Sediminibacillus albus]SDJ89022.1 Uncharacterized protein YhaN [Sediminibacillus albus]
MKLLEVHIYGFGKWQDFQIDFPSDNLFVISGDNESGKSTIRLFLLFILFGLPPKARKQLRPKTGGRIGGRLKVFTEENGTFYIERIHEKQNGEAVCYLEDGTVLGEDWLRQLLKGINRDQFQSVFSFDADDLTKLHSINEEDLGELLLGVGMTGTDKIYAVEKQLDNELDKRFKPQGKNPQINSQLKKLQEIEAELTKLQEQEDTYYQKKMAESDYVNEIHHRQKLMDSLKSEKSKQEKLIQALPLLHQLSEAERKLADLPETLEFPENGITRYEALQEQLFPLKSELSVLESSLQKYHQKLSGFQQDTWPEETMQKVEKLISRGEEYQQLLSQSKFQAKQKAEAESELGRMLEELNLGLEREELDTLIFPFHIEETWNNIKEEDYQLQAEIDKLHREEQALAEQKRALETEKNNITENLLEDEQVQALAKAVESREKSEVSHEQRNSWERVRKKRSKISFAAMLWMSTGAAALFFFAFLTETAILNTVAGILLFAGLFQAWWTKRSLRMLDMHFPEGNQSVHTPPINQEEWERADMQLQKHNEMLGKRDKLAAEHKQTALELLKITERKNFFLEKQQGLMQRVDQQLTEYPFLTDVDTAYWPKLYHRLSACLEKHRSAKRYQAELDNIEQEIDKLTAEVTAFYKQHGWTSTGKFMEDVNNLKERLEEQKEINHKIAQYKELIAENEQKQQDISSRMKPYQQERDKLWKAANVNSEEAFLQNGRKQQEANALEEKADSLFHQLAGLFSNEEIKQTLAALPTEAQVYSELEKTAADITEAEARLDECRQNLSDIRSLISQMEKSESYSISKHQFHREMGVLKQQIKQWAVYQTAKELLEETKKTYQHKYLPRTLETAAAYFTQLTGGRYTKIIPPNLNQPFEVADGNGFRFRVEELSKGTADQLYISIRLALSKMFETENAMPFFIDDAFVHFDAKRAGTFGKILKQASLHQQVILFTSNRSIANTFGDVPVIDLGSPEVIELA